LGALRLAIIKTILVLSIVYLDNSINRKIAPETPSATMKPFQKSVWIRLQGTLSNQE